MLKVKNDFSVEYNSLYDVLYVRLKNSPETYADEEVRGILINCDYETNEIVGFDIWDFKKRITLNEDIPLPVKIDLEAIYESLTA
jgi:uncharacterized protein YuzE